MNKYCSQCGEAYSFSLEICPECNPSKPIAAKRKVEAKRKVKKRVIEEVEEDFDDEDLDIDIEEIEGLASKLKLGVNLQISKREDGVKLESLAVNAPKTKRGNRPPSNFSLDIQKKGQSKDFGTKEI